MYRIFMGIQKTKINEDVLSENFSDYANDSFIKINQDTSYDYGISYNYYYPPESVVHYSFMGNIVSKAAFAVGENNSIEQVILYLEIFDIDFFYKDLVKKYGEPEIVSLSKAYIEQHGFKIPPDMENFNENSYDSLPKPKLEDYKNLRNVNWYEVNASANKVETSLIVRNHLVQKVIDAETHTVEVIFRK